MQQGGWPGDACLHQEQLLCCQGKDVEASDSLRHLQCYRFLMVKAVNERTSLSDHSCIKHPWRLSPCKTECVFQGYETPQQIQQIRRASVGQGNLSRAFKLHFQEVQNLGKWQCNSLTATMETGYLFQCTAIWLLKGQSCFGPKGDEEKRDNT